MKNIKNVLLFALGIFVVFSIGCTRPKSNSSSSISISVPKSMSSQKVGAMAFDTLAHVAINVTGDGMLKPIVFNWDAHESASMTAPTITLDIPKGTNRLIQVLAVYMDSSSSSGQMQFYYGDVVKNLSNSTETVAIGVTSVGGGSQVITGRIAGRYITETVSGVDVGPTGLVDVIYAPPSGRPPMIIEQSSIINGWFHFLGLQGAKFGYRLASGALLFGGPVEMTAAYFPASNQVLRVAAPLRLQYEYMGNSQQWVTENPSVYIYGYFGNPTSTASKNVCVSTSPAFSKMARTSSQAMMLTLATNTADPNLFNADNTGVYTSGGNLSCGAPMGPYQNYLAFNPSVLENGNDNAATFRGLFTVSNSNWLSASTVDSNTRTISGSLLPGVPFVLDKIIAFKKVGSGSTQTETASCYELQAQGFVPAGEGPIANGTPDVVTPWSMNIPVTAAEISSGVLLALCPAKNGIMAARGAWVRGDMLGGGGGGMLPVASKLAFTDFNTSPGYFYCGNAFMIEAQDSGGGLAQLSASTPITLTTSNVSAIYSDPLCLSSVAGSAGTFYTSISGSRTYFYYKVSAQMSPTSIAVTASGLTAANTISVTSASSDPSATSPLTIGFKPDTMYSHKLNECIPVPLYAKNGSLEVTFNSSTMGLSTYPLNLSITGGTGAYYSNAACAGTSLASWGSTQVGTSPFLNLTSAPIYARITSGSSVNFVVSQAGTACGGSGCNSTSPSYSLLTDVNNPTVGLRLDHRAVPLSPVISTCYPIVVEAVDSNYFPSVQSSSLLVNVGVTGAGACSLYSDVSCTSSTTTATIPMGESRAQFYSKGTAAGACLFSATSGALNAASSVSVSY